MRKMQVYKYIGSYGDGIALLDPKTVCENIFNLYSRWDTWEYIGVHIFSEKILIKLDTEKTLDTHGEINLSYIE